MTVSSSEIKRNMTILLDGEVYRILDWQHRQAPKAPPTLTIKARNLNTGNVFEKKLPGSHKLTLAPTESRQCQYLYADKDVYAFMDSENYEQYELSKALIADALPYIREGDHINVVFYNDNPLYVELPASVTLEISFAEVGVRGDTQGSVTKNATTETGLNVQVPLFIKEGDKINVNTQTGEYIGRA